MPDRSEEGKQNLESWFIGGERAQAPIEEQVTLPPAHDDPPPVIPDPHPDPKPSNWARYAVLIAAMLAFGGAGAYHFYPKLIGQPEPIPVAPDPEPPIRTPDPAPPEPAPIPAPIVEERKPVIPAPKPEPKKKDVTPPIEPIQPPPPKPAPIPPPVVVVPQPAPEPVPAPPPPVRPRLTKPDTNTIVTPPPPPVYSGPPSGVINWSGRLDKNGSVAIEGLPGVPVMIDLDTKEFAIAEAPSPSNGWKRLVIRSRRKVHSVVTIRWTIVQQ